MNPQNYHKVYMNHVQSSTLLAQLATMWKSQTLCDAIIKTGSISTRAHRVVLVAACPMLQTMENATSGSHLEVRLASDIAQESVNAFLQYLYEGFMILTEDNCSDVEKIARLLQVDSVTKCCADFQKCLNRSAGSQFKYSFQEQTEFKHVRVSDLFKKQERSTKRAGDLHRPPSPGSKRQRLHRPSSPKIHDTSSMAESYGATSDPWERVPRLGSGFQGPGVIDIREDGFELVQTEPPKKDITGNQEPRKVQTSVSLSVSSQHNTSSDLRVVNVTGDSAPPVPHPVSKPPSAPPPITNMSGSSRDPITVSPITFHDSPSSSSSSVEISRSMPQSDKTSSKKEVDKQPQPTIHIPDYSDPQFSDINTNIVSRSDDNVSSTQYKSPYPVAMSQVSRPVPVGPPKPFASGSASQSESSPAFSDPVQSPGNQRPQATKERSDSLERPPSTGKAQDTGQGRPDDKDIDLSIVKVESAGQRDIENLQMYMSEGGMTMNVQAHRSEEDDPDPNNSFDLEEPPGEWSRDEMSNEGSNVSGGDQSGNWYMGQFKGKTSVGTKAGIFTKEEAELHNMVQLVPNAPVYVHKFQYSIALQKIKISDKTRKTDGTPAARYLLGIFFDSHELLHSSFKISNRQQSKLNPSILYAIEEFCLIHSESTPGKIKAAIANKISSKRFFFDRRVKKYLPRYENLNMTA